MDIKNIVSKLRYLSGGFIAVVAMAASTACSPSVDGDTASTFGQNNSSLSEAEYPTEVLWGDTHLHTSNSFDARAVGATLDAEAAYRFARGEEVVSSSGQAARLARPLDFLVVSDHST